MAKKIKELVMIIGNELHHMKWEKPCYLYQAEKEFWKMYEKEKKALRKNII